MGTISPSVEELRKLFLKKIFFLIRPRKIKKEEENVQHEIDRLRHSVGLLRQRGRRTGSQREKDEKWRRQNSGPASSQEFGAAQSFGRSRYYQRPDWSFCEESVTTAIIAIIATTVLAPITRTANTAVTAVTVTHSAAFRVSIADLAKFPRRRKRLNIMTTNLCNEPSNDISLK